MANFLIGDFHFGSLSCRQVGQLNNSVRKQKLFREDERGSGAWAFVFVLNGDLIGAKVLDVVELFYGSGDLFGYWGFHEL